MCSLLIAILVLLTASVYPVAAQDQTELAKKLQNPVANLISMPMQSNWDFGIGRTDAMRYTLNVQPIIPVSLNANWNLITRTIMPIVHVESPIKGGRDKSGLGDILQSFFLSPVEPVGGWTYGVLVNHLWSFSAQTAGKKSAPHSFSRLCPTPQKRTRHWE